MIVMKWMNDICNFLSAPVLLVLCLVLNAGHAYGQESVVVTMRLDTNMVSVGESTMLRVYGQVSTNLEAQAEQILTWYVDLFNGNGLVASADYGLLVKASSDNDPFLSGMGADEGLNNRRGIYDTFLNQAGAGVSNRVELLSVPVRGESTGMTTFSVGAGSGVTNLVADFQVAPKGGGLAWIGGDYSLASVELEVVGVGCELTLAISRGDLGGGPGGTLDLSFDPCPGFDHTVQYTDVLETGATWLSVAGGPHNSGMVTVTNGIPARFYRVMAVPQ
jgi:hypothetical protein